MTVHLHTHSHYSFLEGLASPAELAQAAARDGMVALALTDHLWLTGAVEFYEACQEVGVQPILGLELDLAVPADQVGYLPAESPRAAPLVLLAMDLSGWGSLCRLSSAVLTDPAAEPSRGLAFERLAQDAGGLICLTGGSRSLVDRLVEARQSRAAERWLRGLKELFPDHLYLELQTRTEGSGELLRVLERLGGRLEIPRLAAHNLYYFTDDQQEVARLAAAIRLNRPVDRLVGSDLPHAGAHFLSQEELEGRFADYPGALAATDEVAGRCRTQLPLGVPRFPDLPLPEGRTAQDELRQRALENAQELYGIVTPVIQDRLDHELDVIESSGYAALFLIMQQILEFAEDNGIPFSSRGSAASSLVAHCLGITYPDPLRLNLYFERFLNPARVTPPDIDTDLCSRRRDEVIHFVYTEFGSERVAMVSTINRFRWRSALREAAKAYGLAPAQVNRLVSGLPYRGWGPPGRRSAGEIGPYEQLSQEHPDPLHQAIFRQAAALIGQPRHLSIHPGGMVISPGPLTDLVPLQLASKGVIITQFDLESIEKLGLVKIDLLGIRGLSVLGDVAQALHEAEPRRYTKPLQALEEIPSNDPLTAEMVRDGNTIGCFQIESPGMRATLREIQACSEEDLMVALALYRPGPLTGGLKDAFVRRHRGEEPVSHLHPALAPLLEDTYGVILYQEQVLRIAHELAGLSLADADLLRRAMSHFDPGEQMRTLQERFVSGAAARGGLPEAVAERVWELMAAFAGYGFPKAHAASYAQVAWRAAWCKAHHPALFMAAVLANWGGYYGQRAYLTEARRMGLTLRPPHVNHAQQEFSLSYQDGEPVLFMGLNQVRELTHRTQRRILGQRPFRSLIDFLARVDPQPAEAENLARAGALAGMGSIPALLRQIRLGGWRGGQLSLFSLDNDEVEEWSLEERVAAQEAVLGVGVDAHILELHAAEIEAARAVTTLDAASQVGQRVRVAGVKQTWHRWGAGRGNAESYLWLEDLDGLLEVVIPAEVSRRNKAVLQERGPYLIEGNIERDPSSGEPLLRAERVRGLR